MRDVLRRRRARRASPTSPVLIARRDRHRQGRSSRAPPRAEHARRRPVRHRQLRGAARAAPRERAVRPREGRVHRARRATAPGLFAEAQRRHALPRRDRRDVAGAPGQAARRARERRVVRASAPSKERAVDVRVIAATHRDLRRARARRRLPRGSALPPRRRHDRAAAAPPPARGHPAAHSSISSREARARTRSRRSSASRPRPSAQLVDYRWPGNVRELAHAVERVVLLARAARRSPRPTCRRASRVAATGGARSFAGEVMPDARAAAPLRAWALEQLGGHKARTAEGSGST